MILNQFIMKKNAFFFPAVFSVVAMMACSDAATPVERIRGSWKGTIQEAGIDMELDFINANQMVASSSRDTKADTMEYKISEDGKKLTTTEKNKSVTELNILELTKTDLVLNRKADTLRLKRK